MRWNRSDAVFVDKYCGDSRSNEPTAGSDTDSHRTNAGEAVVVMVADGVRRLVTDSDVAAAGRRSPVQRSV